MVVLEALSGSVVVSLPAGPSISFISAVHLIGLLSDHFNSSEDTSVSIFNVFHTLLAAAKFPSSD